MPNSVRCRSCGDSISFQHRPGFIVRGQSRYFAVNSDDGTPHGALCKLNQDLATLRKGEKPRKVKTGNSNDPQGEMFK